MYIVFVIVYDYEFVGVYFDNVFMDYFVKEFMKKYNDVDFCFNFKSFVKFCVEVENIKKVFSLGINVQFSVEFFVEGFDFFVIINRICYEMVGCKVFEGFNCFVEGVVKKVGFDVLDIDEVIMCGGIFYIFWIVNNFCGIFFEIIVIFVFVISVIVINFFEFQVCGVVFQVFLIQEYEVSDIEQFIYFVVIIVKYILNVIGVVIVGVDGFEVFIFVMFVEMVVFVCCIVQIFVFVDGGDVFICVVEGGIYIKVIKFEFKEFKLNGVIVVDVDEDDFEFDESDEEEEEK